jgi:ligand-binding sensor domain-containing protein
LHSRDGRLAAATSRGAFLLETGGPRRVGQFAGLRHPHVSALALDGAGALWVGFFEGGVDRVDPATLRLSSIPGLENCPDVNHLRWDRRAGRMAVATVRGVLEHDGAAVTRSLRERDGLIGDNVAFSLSLPDGAMYGCEKGLTFERAGRLESLSGFQGLPSNHVYCGASFQGRLAVGTLGGLVILDGARVVKVIAATRQGLPANWVTSLVELPEGLFVGTYGGGGCLMGPDGAFQPHPPDAGRLEFNNGAVLTLDGQLLVGTLSRGLLVTSLSPEPTTRSRFVTTGLGHPDVTALAAGESALYVGTEAGLTMVPRELLVR